MRPALQCHQIPPKPKTDTLGDRNASLQRAIPTQARKFLLSMCSAAQQSHTSLGRSQVSGALSPERGRFPKRLSQRDFPALALLWVLPVARICKPASRMQTNVSGYTLSSRLLTHAHCAHHTYTYVPFAFHCGRPGRVSSHQTVHAPGNWRCSLGPPSSPVRDPDQQP